MRLAQQDAITRLDADFGAMAVRIGRHAWGLPELSMREKAFVFLAADLSVHDTGFALWTHIEMARANGVGPEALREATRHLAPYVGYPTAAAAMMVLAEVDNADAGDAGDTKAPFPSPGDTNAPFAPPGDTNAPCAPRTRVGTAAELDADTLERVERLDPAFAAFLHRQFTERWNRPGMTVRERALATLATDVLHGTLDDSFRLHVTLARTHGAGVEQVRSVLLLVAEYGVAQAWRAYTALAALPDDPR